MTEDQPRLVDHDPAQWGAGLPTQPARRAPVWLRVAWVVWSLSWALFWITLGWLFAPLLNVLLFLLSLVAAAAFADWGRRARH
jgi:hypothetical protein